MTNNNWIPWIQKSLEFTIATIVPWHQNRKAPVCALLQSYTDHWSVVTHTAWAPLYWIPSQALEFFDSYILCVKNDYLIHHFSKPLIAFYIFMLKSQCWIQTMEATEPSIGSFHKQCCALRIQLPYIQPCISHFKISMFSWTKCALTQNIPRIGKLPYGAKRGFIERKSFLKTKL